MSNTEMFKYDGQVKGAQLGPYRYLADGIIYFGQWQVSQHSFSTEPPTARE